MVPETLRWVVFVCVVVWAGTGALFLFGGNFGLVLSVEFLVVPTILTVFFVLFGVYAKAHKL